MKIRPEESKDYQAVDQLNKIAFGQDAEARLVDKIRQSPHYIPELSLVAEEEDKIIGHILFSRVKINTGADSVSVLSLAPMAVLPEPQRQGIGSLMVKEGLKEARRLGEGAVVVVGHPEYYPKFGFVSARETGLEASFIVPDEAFLAYELIPELLGGVSGMVEYPPAFNEMV